MLDLAQPWALLLLLLPLLMRLLPAYKESRESVRVPFFAKLLELSQRRPERGARVPRRARTQQFLVAFMWLCLVLGAARPEWVGPPLEQQKSGRDLMIAVDLSGSMQTRDFFLPSGASVDRLEAIRYVLRELAAQRESDRLGLIVFGSAAYLQAPFTEDHDVWLTLLDETAIGMAGQSTVFGDAVGLAIKLFRESRTDNRVLIILTDGNDTGSSVPPRDAARVAAAHGIRIYTIAVGDPASVGEEALDLDTLARVATLTGGRSFTALDQSQLSEAYAQIARLEPNLYETTSFRPRQSLHWLPIAIGLALFVLYHLLESWRTVRAAGRGERVHAA